jgi:hypothetical protein
MQKTSAMSYKEKLHKFRGRVKDKFGWRQAKHQKHAGAIFRKRNSGN